MGMPWEKDVDITPLPEPGKPDFLNELIEDALKKGAKVVNKRYGHDRTFVAPTVIYPAKPDMKIFSEEQFGPVVPIVSFKKRSEIFDYINSSPYGQQAAIFSNEPNHIAKYVDILANLVSRVNINCQCQRGPDKFPFTGRKDSAYGTLSVYDALRVFSLRTCVATVADKHNTSLITTVVKNPNSNFLRLDYLF
jgi:glyceraldehyde-3-phosphate dehydrogenase (NADP+)